MHQRGCGCMVISHEVLSTIQLPYLAGCIMVLTEQ